MNNSLPNHCKMVSDQKWSLSSFTEFYERILSPRLFRPYGELLVKEIKKDIGKSSPSRRILEVACGTGCITTSLYEELAKPLNIELVATDLSKIAIDVAKSVASEELNRNVSFMADVDMANMPFPDNSFDVIVCGFGLMFPPDKARVAREFKRVLCPGGKIYGTVFHYNELFELARRESHSLFGNPSAILDAALSLSDHTPVTRAFSLEELCQNVDQNITLHPLTFHLNDDDTREFLFNVCILLEEFNQCDSSSREKYLDSMLLAFHTQVPSRSYQVNAWLIRGCVEKSGKESINQSLIPNFSELNIFYQSTLRKNDQSSPYSIAKHSFLAQYPGYSDSRAELLREAEFSRLDIQQLTYLDHVGGTLPPQSLLEEDYQMLTRTILGNPHSGSRSSDEHYEQARQAIYRFFQCAPDEYEILFTANASSAIRLVAEAFPFETGSHVLLTKDNHTSVHGLREYARNKGAQVKYIPLDQNLQILENSMKQSLDNLATGHMHLLAYPAQSNATGVKHDLKWINIAQECGAMVLLDAAAFVPQSRLDYCVCQPDFVAISFYKMFGYPTGIGCLIAKRSSLQKLTPTSFAGGSVCYYSGPWSPTERLLYRDAGRRFEVGTPNYAAFHAIAQGIQYLSRYGQEDLGQRSIALARWLESQLLTLHHSEKFANPLCRIYGLSAKSRGATVMLNFFDYYNAVFPHLLIKQAMENVGIIVRNGCFCNLGAVQQATYTTAGAEHCELDKSDIILDCKSFDENILDKGNCGAVRISFGLGSTFRDAYCLYLFAKGLLNIEVSGLENAVLNKK